MTHDPEAPTERVATPDGPDRQVGAKVPAATAPAAAPAPSSRPGRGPRLGALALVFVLVGVAGIAMLAGRGPQDGRPAATPTHSLTPIEGSSAAGLLATRAEIEARVAAARAGQEPFASALEDLLVDANDFLDARPGPRETLDIPGTDGPFVEDSTMAYGLALAYVATDDERYATHAAEFIRAWATTNRATRNTCVDDGACQTSLIIGRVAPAFAFAVELIEPSGALTAADRAAVDAWFRTVILPTASIRDNNWGDAGTFMRLAISSHLGDAEAFDSAVARWRAMLDLVAADGHIPEEVRRGDEGIMYTQEALQYKVAGAVIAGRRGIDLWSYVGADGGTLKGALDYLARFADPSVSWPWHRSAEFPTPASMWEIVYARWAEPAYEPLVMAGRPFGQDGHSAIRWTTITAAGGVPDVAVVPSASAPAPTATPTPASATPTPLPTPTPAPTATAGATADPTPRPDLEPPPVVVALRTGGFADLGHLPIAVDWTAPDSDDLKRSEVERWDDGKRVARTAVDAGKPTILYGAVPISTDLRYRVRVSVSGSGTSDWTDTDLRLRLVADDDDAIDYGGSWASARHEAYQGGRARYTTRAGASATIRFEGTAIAWLGPVGPGRGRAAVRLDGERIGTVDMAAGTFSARHVLYVADAGEAGQHVLEIEALGGGTVAIDALVEVRP